MAGVLSGLLNLVTIVFAVSSMLSVGLGHTWTDIIGPLRNVRRVGRALVANFVLVPLLAYLVVRVLVLDDSLAVGLMLIAMAAGTPFLIKLTTAAGGDVGLSATLLVLLLPATVIYMPFVVPLVVPAAEVSVGAIALPLILSMLLPLAMGLFVKVRASGWAERLQPIMAQTSGYTLMALIGLTVAANLPGILDVTMRSILAAMLFVGGAFAIGYLLGGRNPDARDVLGLGTGQRNVAAATVVATQGFDDPDTLIMVVVTALVGLAVLFPIAAKLREREGRRHGLAEQESIVAGAISREGQPNKPPPSAP
ncbi:bile acid:sodium symporter family protein [Phycisphaerales bacterium AB-hyl4]|uniref:Bile acid:sodium symporter family protein n=1 Tax=Natronomicrosphaera hydrolytica TaxID=3242702 RepID=A0ABV4UAW2_9BACT